jgi:hypothetical protein
MPEISLAPTPFSYDTSLLYNLWVPSPFLLKSFKPALRSRSCKELPHYCGANATVRHSKVGRFLMKKLFLKRKPLESIRFYVRVQKTCEKKCLRSLLTWGKTPNKGRTSFSSETSLVIHQQTQNLTRKPFFCNFPYFFMKSTNPRHTLVLYSMDVW